MIEALQAANLKEHPNIRHGFFTRCGGVSEGIHASLNCGLSGYFDDAEVTENRRRVAEQIGVLPENLLSCLQVHSPDVVTITQAWKKADRPKADAMVTKEKGIALGILTADCLPVLFVDSRAGVIGAAHAGWRGAISGVIDNTVKAMETLGASRRDIVAALGPCIWQNSYEVGPEFPASFLAEDPANEKYFRPAFRSDHYMFDLPGYVMAKLCALGIRDVEPSPADTYADETHFFSYRRDCQRDAGGGGRLISVIAMAA